MGSSWPRLSQYITPVEIAVGHLGDEYLAGFKQIARKRRTLLIPNILQGIFSDPSLKSDEIHPNDAGYRLIAERIYKKIRPLLKRYRTKRSRRGSFKN